MKTSKKIFMTVLIISLFGLLMIYSSSYVWAEFKYSNPYKFVINQGIFFIVGVVLMYLVSRIDYRLYQKYSNILLIAVIILLILVLIPGIGSLRNGSRSWFKVGSFGLQPSEAAKTILIIFVSKYLSKYESKVKDFKKYVIPILIVIFLIFALIMLQPDLGTGVILVISALALLYVGKVDIKFFLKMGLLGLVAFIGLVLVAPYRMDRITAYINPWSDPLGSGFQTIQSLFSIGPSGLFGFGLFNSIQKHFYLPEPQTDFIFSIILEELGFMGGILVLALFGLIIYYGFKTSFKTNDLFGKYLSFGITFQIGFQAMMNLMVVTGVIPVTGVTLPFISYGGSSLVISMVSMGIVCSIARNNN